MGLILRLLAVTAVASFSGALAVPLGVFLGLHPLVVYLVTVATATAVVWGLLLGGHRLRTYIADRMGHGEHTERRTRRVVERYGPVGLGLIGPLFPGVITSTISGVAIDLDAKHLGRWLTVGIAWWFGVFTAVWWVARGAMTA